MCDLGVATCSRQISSTEAAKTALRASQRTHALLNSKACTRLSGPHLQEPYRWGPVQSELAGTPSGLAAPHPLVRRHICPRGLPPGCQSPAEHAAALAGKPREWQPMLHITVLQRLSPHCKGPGQGGSCQRRHLEPSQAVTSILQAQQAVQTKMWGFCSVRFHS